MASPSQSNFINSAVFALTLIFFSIAAFDPVITKLFHIDSGAYAAQQLLAHVFPPATSSTKDYQHPKASEDHLWQEAETTASMSKQTERSKVPVSYRSLRLNRDALTQLLNPTPMELTATRNVITLPMPEGTLARFHFEESPIMEPGLAAQFPEIKTYHGQGVDDPTATARFDWTPAGFHAMSLSVHGTVMVEPFSKEDANTYICYYKSDMTKDVGYFRCLVPGDNAASIETGDEQLHRADQVALRVANGEALRLYRLAVATTGEYARTYGGGTISSTLAAIVTNINLVNAVVVQISERG